MSSFSLLAWSGDEDGNKNDWLVKFLSSELTFATADIESEVQTEMQQKEMVKVHFDFSSNTYSLDHFVHYEQSWNELTKDGTINPPKIKPLLTGSTIEPWTKIKENGVYQEKLKKQIPNWFVFENISPILNSIALSNYSPTPNGMFREDELKYLKKMYKSKDIGAMSVWRQLTYDRKGNIAGIAADYLKGKLKTDADKEYISIFNERNEELKISSVTSNITALVSAIVLEKDGNRLTVLNAELNFILHKFASFIFPDPANTRAKYFQVFHKKVKKGLDRFSDNLVTNE